MKSTTTWRSFSTLNLTLAGGLGILGGAWLIVSPYLFDYSNLNVWRENTQNAALMGLIGGIIAIALSVFCIATEKMPALQTYRHLAGWGMVALGVLLMAAPYLFNYSKLRDPLWNLQITGGLFTLIAGFIMQELYERHKEEKAS